MTRKEAIIRIKDHIDIHRMYEPKGTKISEALDMAIKSLEQPEIIHCEECVYAKENQGELWICAHPDNNAWRITKKFYCGKAERREE